MFVIAEVNFATNDTTIAYREAALVLAVGHDTITTSGPLYGAFAVALKSTVGSIRDQVLGNMHIADYDGHAPVALTWATPFLDEGGEPYVLASRISFVPTGHDTIGAQEITGVALVGSDSVTLMAARNLASPFTINETTPLYLDLTISLGTPTHQV